MNPHGKHPAFTVRPPSTHGKGVGAHQDPPRSNGRDGAVTEKDFTVRQGQHRTVNPDSLPCVYLQRTVKEPSTVCRHTVKAQFLEIFLFLFLLIYFSFPSYLFCIVQLMLYYINVDS